MVGWMRNYYDSREGRLINDPRAFEVGARLMLQLVSIVYKVPVVPPHTTHCEHTTNTTQRLSLEGK